MKSLTDMLWIETRKALRSRMPLWTALGSLFMPLGIALLIYLARNPEISHKLGVVGAKADLMKYSATDWPSYLGLYGQLIAVGGFFLFIIAISWTFGREFVDGTLKDLLAVPVPRAEILLAKFILVGVWSVLLSLLILATGLLMGKLIGLPGGTSEVLIQGSLRVLVTACLSVPVILPFAFFASAGRGYLLPLGLAVLTLMITNLAAVLGWGEYFPWAIPGLYSQLNAVLPAASYWIAILTGVLGMLVTYFWWKYADQNR